MEKRERDRERDQRTGLVLNMTGTLGMKVYVRVWQDNLVSALEFWVLVGFRVMGALWFSGVIILRVMWVSRRCLNALQGTGCDMNCCDFLWLGAVKVTDIVIQSSGPQPFLTYRLTVYSDLRQEQSPFFIWFIPVSEWLFSFMVFFCQQLILLSLVKYFLIRLTRVFFVMLCFCLSTFWQWG